MEFKRYKLGVMVYRCLYGQAPCYLADHLIPASDAAPRRGRLRCANRNCLTVPRCRLSTYGCRVFDYAGPTVWNSLPDDSLPDELRNSDSFDNVLNGSRKQFSLAATVSSALEVIFYNEMCYIGRKKQNRRRNVLQSVNINAETLLIN